MKPAAPPARRWPSIPGLQGRSQGPLPKGAERVGGGRAASPSLQFSRSTSRASGLPGSRPCAAGWAHTQPPWSAGGRSGPRRFADVSFVRAASPGPCKGLGPRALGNNQKRLTSRTQRPAKRLVLGLVLIRAPQSASRNAVEWENLARHEAMGWARYVLLFLEPAGMSRLAAGLRVDHSRAACSVRDRSVLTARGFRNLALADPLLALSSSHGGRPWKVRSSENSTRAAAPSLRLSMSCRNAACREATSSSSPSVARTRRGHARPVLTPRPRLRRRDTRSWKVRSRSPWIFTAMRPRRSQTP